MKLSTIAFKNIKRNFTFYSLYLFSVAFVLMIFFSFISFSMNEVIMKSISSDGRVETMCRVVAVFVMAFVIFYMSYSNTFFMRRRMRELGVYALLGYQKLTMLQLLTVETVFVCAGGLVVGVVAGGLLHKGLTSAIVALLGLSIDKSRIPLINPDAVMFSIVFVLVVLVALAFSNGKLLWKASLLDLVRLETKHEAPIKAHGSMACCAALLLLAGYAFALDILRGRASLWYTVGFSPMALITLVCVVSGTALFIYSLCPYICQKIKKRKSRLYRENTIVVVPKFMHRIRSSAASLVVLILLSAGTLAVLGATVLSVWYPLMALKRIVPTAIEYQVSDPEQEKQAFDALGAVAEKDSYQTYATNIVKVEASSPQLPYEYTISQNKGRSPGFECISETDYNSLMRLQKNKTAISPLADDECILIKYRPNAQKSDVGATYTLNTGSNETVQLKVIDTSLQNPIGFGNSVGTLVVSDAVYQKLLESNLQTTRVISVDGKGVRSNKAMYQALKQAMPSNVYLVSAYQRQQELISENSSTLLLVCFATIIFLIATGSILHFQNISAVTYDKPDYAILMKMGYNTAMIKRIVRRQLQLYFGIPYTMGVVHSIFALICYKSALMDDLLGKTSAVAVPIIFSIVLFTAIYLVYYHVTKRSCYKIALN